MWDGHKHTNYFYETMRFINDPRTPNWKRVAGRLMLDGVWNMYRRDASIMLGEFDKQIKKTGGSRQRHEGRKLIARIQVRLREWV